MFKREKFVLTVMMIFAAVSLGGVTLSPRIQLYNKLFAALPLVFVGGVTAVYSSKIEHDSQTASSRKNNERSVATNKYDFTSDLSPGFPENMNSEVCAPAGGITDTAVPCVSVLIVAPTEDDIELIKDMLRPFGMRLDCVDNGQSAVELIAAEDLKYDAIFIDYPMPVMDGLETVDLIRGIATDHAQSVPIIAVSSDEMVSEDAFTEKGFQAFVAEPVDAVELNEIINRWVTEAEKL